MSWRVLYIETSDYLSLYLDNLKVKKGIDETTVPLSDINSIVIDNYSTVLSVGLINKCMEYKVNIITCDIYHNPNGIIIPLSGNYQSAYQLKKQINWDQNSKEYLWQQIIKKKIINQNQILINNDKDIQVIKHLEKFESEVEIGDKTNREGLSAKMYFRELFGNKFNRGLDDVVNAGLNYGYSIIRSQICRALIARGLNPHLGIFHINKSNQFNLSDDLIEVFRPIIDDYVYKNLLDKESFLREHRLSLIELTTKRILIDDKKQTILNAINILIDGIIYFMDTGDILRLKLPEVKIYE